MKNIFIPVIVLFLIVSLFSACRKNEYTTAKGVVKDANTGAPIANAQFYMHVSCKGISCGGHTIRKSDDEGNFRISLENKCSPGLEIRKNGQGINAFVFIDVDREVFLKKLICDRTNSAQLEHNKDYSLQILRYPGIDISMRQAPKGEKAVKANKLIIRGLAEGHPDVVRSGFYPVKDSISDLIITRVFEDDSIDVDTFRYHHLNNFLYKAYMYK